MSDDPRSASPVEAALAYASRRWHVFPIFEMGADGKCACGDDDCADPGKHPRTTHGFKDATTDPTRISKWWKLWPSANVGIATGEISGFWVADIDPRHGGDKTLAELEREHGTLPPTIEAKTGGGGGHYAFRHPGQDLRCAVARLPGIDVRGDRGYVVVAPSNHELGAPYAWREGRAPGEIELAEAPDWLLTLALTAKNSKQSTKSTDSVKSVSIDMAAPIGGRYAEAALSREVQTVASAAPGTRNDTLNRSAFSLGQLVAGGELDRGVVEQQLTMAAKAAGDGQPGEDRKIAGTIQSGISAGAQRPRSAPTLGVSRSHSRAATRHAKRDVLVPGSHITSDGEYVEQGSDQFAADVLDAMPPGALYRRGDVPGELVGEPGRRNFRPCTLERARLLVDRGVRLVGWKPAKDEEGDGKVPKCFFRFCNSDWGRLVLGSAVDHPRVAELHVVTRCPSFVGPRAERLAPGFDPLHGIYYDEHPTLRGIEPIQDRARIAAILDDLLVDFPFQAESDRQNFIGVMVAQVVRPAIVGNFPLHLVVSSLERSGKTKLVEQVLGRIIDGEPLPALQMTDDEREREKRTLALLLSGVTKVHLDNLPPHLDSRVLASLITAEWFMGRVLGISQMARVRNDLALVGSGNNVRASGEVAKRSVPIRLLPQMDHPENRTQFSHPELPEYLDSTRPEIVGALLGMVCNWKAAGMPKGNVPFGGFESFAKIVGGIMSVQGYDAWLANRAEWVGDADLDGGDLEALVDAWIEKGGGAATPRDLFGIAESNGLFPAITSVQPQQRGLTVFGRRVLLPAIQRPIRGHRIVAVGSGSSRSYRLERLEVRS